MKFSKSRLLWLIIILGGISVTTVLADTVTIINTYPYVIQDGSANQRLVITNTGNVGVGTSNPWGILNANGVPGATPTITATSGNQFFYFNPNLCQGCVNPLVQAGDEALIFSNGPQNSGNFVLGNWNSAPVGIRITNNGNVGIDTAIPQQKLDVGGNIRLTGNITSASTNEFKITAPPGVPICIGTGC